MERNGSQRDSWGEYELRIIDPFTYAYKPPHDWQRNERFLRDFDASVEAVFEEATHPILRPATRLKIDQANELLLLLGLSAMDVPVGAKIGGIDKAKDYLRAAKSKYPGRLIYGEQGNKRVAAMSQLINEFAIREHATIDDIMMLFGNNPQARLLLKGAVAEVLRASIEGVADERKRGVGGLLDDVIYQGHDR